MCVCVCFFFFLFFQCLSVQLITAVQSIIARSLYVKDARVQSAEDCANVALTAEFEPRLRALLGEILWAHRAEWKSESIQVESQIFFFVVLIFFFMVV